MSEDKKLRTVAHESYTFDSLDTFIRWASQYSDGVKNVRYCGLGRVRFDIEANGKFDEHEVGTYLLDLDEFVAMDKARAFRMVEVEDTEADAQQ